MTRTHTHPGLRPSLPSELEPIGLGTSNGGQFVDVFTDFSEIYKENVSKKEATILRWQTMSST